MEQVDPSMPRIPYGQVFTQRAAEAPDRAALVCGSVTWTRAELETRSNRLAHCFRQRGVGVGDLVTIGLPNGPEFVAAVVAAWKCGATPNPLSPRLPEREVAAILELAQPALVIGFDAIDHGFASWPVGAAPPASTSPTPLGDVVAPRERCLASGGSTGRPKLILLDVPSLYDPDVPATILTPTGPVLVPGPLYHAAPFGSLTQALLAGERCVVMERFDAAGCLDLVEAHAIEQILFVPTMMHRIARLPEAQRCARDVSTLRMVLTGSAPCPAWLMRFFIEWLGSDVMHEVYGGTERIGGTHITGAEWLEHPGSVGRPIQTTQCEIRDVESGTSLPVGEIGEIWFKPVAGRSSTYRYVGAERRDDGAGWESMGDMGRLDADGYLYLADRRTDLILTGGRNVYPAQVELALEEHPHVASSAVIGLPDVDLGQRVHAIVQTTEAVDDAALLGHLRERLVPYALPRSFERVDEPLRDDAGKVRRFALRAERAGASGGGGFERPAS